VGFVEKMNESLFMMMFFFKVVYVGGDLAEKVAGRRNITEKREKKLDTIWPEVGGG
jgi:hypothetical protein